MINDEELGAAGAGPEPFLVGVYSYRDVLVAEVQSLAAKASVRLRTDGGIAGVDLKIIDQEYVELNPGFGRDPGWGVDVSAVVVGLSGESGACAALCQLRGWRHCVELPLGAEWLGELIGGLAGADRRADMDLSRAQSSEAGEPGSGPGGLLIGVLGGVGGAGSSTVSLAIAAAAGCDGAAVLVVDADPLGAGLACPVGAEQRPDRGWEAISSDAQTLDPRALEAALPRTGGFSLLTGPMAGGQDVPTALPAVMAAGRAGFDFTVVDLPRTPAGVVVGGSCDAVVVVTPTSLIGVLGTRRLLEVLLGVPRVLPGELDSRVQLVARCGGPVPLTAVERYLGRPVAVQIPHARLIAERADAGELLHGRSGRKLATWGSQVLGGLG